METTDASGFMVMDPSEQSAPSFDCVLCDAGFVTKTDLQEHFRSHGRAITLPPRRIQEIASFGTPSFCELCGLTCIGVRNFWQHCRKYHPDWRGLDCSYCGKHFLQRSDYERHVETHKNEKEEESDFLCMHCNNKFFTEHALKLHSQGHKQIQQMESSMKDESVPDTSSGGNDCNAVHYGTCNRFGAVKKPEIRSPAFRLKASYCKLCLCQFNTNIALAQHLVTHSIFLCLTCGKEMTTDLRFRNHQKVHLHPKDNVDEGKKKNANGSKKKKLTTQLD